MGTLLLKENRELPHCPQLHKGQMQNYVAEIHFLNQEVLTKATNHHYMQYLLGYVCPGKNLEIKLQVTTKIKNKQTTSNT